MIQIGDKYPENAYKAYLNGQETTLTFKDYAGKWIILYFYPKDNTPG